MLYYQTKFGCKWTRSLEDREAIVIFWLYKPSLWPWYWRQLTNFSEWHSGSWCRITIPSLVSKWSAVQKISSRQTFINKLKLYCDFDIEYSHPIFAQDTLVYDVVLSNQVWLQTDQLFRRYSRNSLIFIYTYFLAVSLTLQIVNQFFCMIFHLVIIQHKTKFG